MEDPNKFDPSSQQKKHFRKGNVVIRMEWCSHCQHLFDSLKRPFCRRKKACRAHAPEPNKSYGGPNVNTGDCYRGWYEHLDTKPVWVDSKADLYRECKKRGVTARALMSGGEMKRPKGA